MSCRRWDITPHVPNVRANHVVAMRAAELDLAAFIARSVGSGRLIARVTCDIAWQLSQALPTLSHHRAMHRDIKPSNIFVFFSRRVRRRVSALALATSEERGPSP